MSYAIFLRPSETDFTASWLTSSGLISVSVDFDAFEHDFGASDTTVSSSNDSSIASSCCGPLKENRKNILTEFLIQRMVASQLINELQSLLIPFPSIY